MNALLASSSTLAGAGWIVSAVVMGALWVSHFRLRNADIADALWAMLVGGLAVVYAVAGDGWPPRRAAIAFMMGSWGARLAIYLLYGRVLGRPADERSAASASFLSFELHAAAAAFFALPALFAATNPTERFSPLELTAAAIWIAAFTGETADRSRIARHWFESLIWVAYALFAAASPWGWIAVTCPLAMAVLLLRRKPPALAQVVL